MEYAEGGLVLTIVAACRRPASWTRQRRPCWQPVAHDTAQRMAASNRMACRLCACAGWRSRLWTWLRAVCAVGCTTRRANALQAWAWQKA